MPLTNHPDGLSSFGIPLIGSGPVLTTGNVFFVDSGASLAADVTANGLGPLTPFATLDYAVGRITANNGDVIFVMSGHAETLTADSGVDVDVAGVTVIGLGHGADRPTFNFTTATAADFKLAAANVEIHNLLFTNGIDDQAMMIETSGDDFEISHCEFRNNATTQALIFINIGVASNDSDRGYVHDCRFISDTASATSAISITALQAGLRIEDNHIRGDYSDSGIQSAVIHTDCVVKGNFIQNDNNTAHGIQFSTTSSGIIQDNYIVTDAIATAMDRGSCMTSGNMFSDDGTLDASATPIPETITAGGASLFQIRDRLGAEADTNAIGDVLTGATGVGTWGTATAYGNAVAFDEVLAYIQDSIRPPAGAYIPGMGTQVIKTGLSGIATADIFNVTDAIIITLIYGEVTTALTGGATEVCSVRQKTDAAGMCADTTIHNDLIDTLYIVPFDVNIAMNGADVPVPGLAQTAGPLGMAIFGKVGDTGNDVEFEEVSGDNTAGTIAWTMYWLPLNSSSAVVAAT